MKTYSIKSFLKKDKEGGLYKAEEVDELIDDILHIIKRKRDEVEQAIMETPTGNDRNELTIRSITVVEIDNEIHALLDKRK